jgi:hypothetical protein
LYSRTDAGAGRPDLGGGADACTAAALAAAWYSLYPVLLRFLGQSQPQSAEATALAKAAHCRGHGGGERDESQESNPCEQYVTERRSTNEDECKACKLRLLFISIACKSSYLYLLIFRYYRI